MPALCINVGLVVNPRIYGFLYRSIIPHVSAPSAKIFTRRSTAGFMPLLFVRILPGVSGSDPLAWETRRIDRDSPGDDDGPLAAWRRLLHGLRSRMS